MIKTAAASILLAALAAPAPALAEPVQTNAPATTVAPAPRIAAKQQVGLPAPRRPARRGPALKTFDLADAGKKKGAQTAAVQKAGPAVPPPPRIKVPPKRAAPTQTAERSKKPRVNAASVIASTVR